MMEGWLYRLVIISRIWLWILSKYAWVARVPQMLTQGISVQDKALIPVQTKKTESDFAAWRESEKIRIFAVCPTINLACFP